MRILAIDPGPTECGYVVLEDDIIHHHGVLPTGDADDEDRQSTMQNVVRGEAVHYDAKVVIEMISSYGMAVGIETFETCVWIGQLLYSAQLCSARHPGRIYRSTIKHHLCGSSKAKDANVRQALIDRFGPGRELAIGTKKNPGPLYGISSHCWAALALAVTYQDLGEACCVDPAREMAAKSARRQLKREKRKAKEVSK